MNGWLAGIEFLTGQGICVFSMAFRLALTLTQHPIHWVPEVLSVG
jgi:hypothetical protein